MDTFDKEKLIFHLPNQFKSLSKEYILNCIFDEKIQSKWQPTVGDIIVGCTGNIFVISGETVLHNDLGGNRYFFGGSMCSRDGSSYLRETHCYTMNASGVWITWGDNGLEAKENPYHSSYHNFRFVPYPHETSRC